MKEIILFIIIVMLLVSPVSTFAQGALDVMQQGLVESRMEANEAYAQAALKTLAAAFEAYRANDKESVYPKTLKELSEAQPPYIDSNLASGAMMGYRFEIVEVEGESYLLVAYPELVNFTGRYSFCLSDSSPSLRFNKDGKRIESRSECSNLPLLGH